MFVNYYILCTRCVLTEIPIIEQNERIRLKNAAKKLIKLNDVQGPNPTFVVKFIHQWEDSRYFKMVTEYCEVLNLFISRFA